MVTWIPQFGKNGIKVNENCMVSLQGYDDTWKVVGPVDHENTMGSEYFQNNRKERNSFGSIQ